MSPRTEIARQRRELEDQPAGWKVTVELEDGSRYRFRYLVDGKEWLNDWHADDHEENPYGSYDSVVDLGPSRESSSL